ncbi:hypothetical protein ACQJBY_043052 [Aegilops geniculata]
MGWAAFPLSPAFPCLNSDPSSPLSSLPCFPLSQLRRAARPRSRLTGRNGGPAPPAYATPYLTSSDGAPLAAPSFPTAPHSHAGIRLSFHHTLLILPRRPPPSLLSPSPSISIPTVLCHGYFPGAGPSGVGVGDVVGFRGVRPPRSEGHVIGGASGGVASTSGSAQGVANLSKKATWKLPFQVLSHGLTVVHPKFAPVAAATVHLLPPDSAQRCALSCWLLICCQGQPTPDYGEAICRL